MQELEKFNLIINVIPNRLEIYMNFTLSFIDSFQFLSSSLDSLIKNLIKTILSIWAKNLIITL